MSQVTPSVVSRLSPNLEAKEVLPFEGRQLITFTDARQGTARHAANIQIASERSFIRSFLYHLAQERPLGDPAAVAVAESNIERIRAVDLPDDLKADLIAQEEQKIQAASAAPTPKRWDAVRARLAASETVAEFLSEIWTERDERFKERDELAEFLLYREIMRRPVRANSAETLGLVRLVVPSVDKPGTALPAAAQRLGLSNEDWGDVVRLLVTHFLRTNVILAFPYHWMNWIDRRQSQITVVRRRDPTARTPPGVRFWPNPYGNIPTRVLRMLLQGLSMSADDRVARDQLEELFDAAWHVLLPMMVPHGEGYRFQLSLLSLAPIEQAFWCPVTRRVVDTTFRGISPYNRPGVPHPRAERIELPVLKFVNGRSSDGSKVSTDEIDHWLATDPKSPF